MANFQFSLWDSFSIQGWTKNKWKTFNSLYEIQGKGSNQGKNSTALSILFMRFCYTICSGRYYSHTTFQFSLWDSNREINWNEFKMVIFQFSLWDSQIRKQIITVRDPPFNSLYEILSAAYPNILLIFDFQFSLWDSFLLA